MPKPVRALRNSRAVRAASLIQRNRRNSATWGVQKYNGSHLASAHVDGESADIGSDLARCRLMKKKIFQTVRSERRIAGGKRILLSFRTGEEHIPAILQLPDRHEESDPVPAALLLHGYSSNKERLADSAGKALLGHGIATLAIDLPLHGERARELESASRRNPMEMVTLWRLALDECATALRYICARPEIDTERLGIVGYSMGAFLGIITASRHEEFKAVVLAAGGDLPTNTPFGSLIRMAADPIRAVRALDGRPLLMINGRFDRTVTPDQAERLYAAASQPKELRWFPTGHTLRVDAIEFAAKWLEEKLTG